MATTPKSSFLRRVAKDLTPTIKDTRKFRLAKPLQFTAEEAQKLAHVFNEVQAVTADGTLTFQQMIVTLATNALQVNKLTSDQVDSAEVTMVGIFTQVGSATRATVVG